MQLLGSTHKAKPPARETCSADSLEQDKIYKAGETALVS